MAFALPRSIGGRADVRTRRVEKGHAITRVEKRQVTVGQEPREPPPHMRSVVLPCHADESPQVSPAGDVPKVEVPII